MSAVILDSRSGTVLLSNRSSSSLMNSTLFATACRFLHAVGSTSCSFVSIVSPLSTSAGTVVLVYTSICLMGPDTLAIAVLVWFISVSVKLARRPVSIPSHRAATWAATAARSCTCCASRASWSPTRPDLMVGIELLLMSLRKNASNFRSLAIDTCISLFSSRMRAIV